MSQANLSQAARQARKSIAAGYVLREVKLSDLGKTRHRMKNPIQVGTLYVFRQPQHDCFQATVATQLTNYTLFSTPQGQTFTPTGGTAILKTAWHTSMDQASLFPQPRKFYIRAMWLQLGGYSSATSASMGTVQDINGFLETALITLQISGRSFLQSHAHRFPCGGGMYGQSSAILTNGLPTNNNSMQMYGQNGETIEQGQSVLVQVDTKQAGLANAPTIPITTATAANDGVGLNGFVYLDGLLFRELL